MTKTEQDTLNELLEKAVSDGDVARAKLCLDKGADITHEISVGQYIAQARNSNEYQSIKSPLPFLVFAKSGWEFSSAMADLFIGRGVDINNITDTKGNTPLLKAVLAGNEKATRYLIDKGAKTDVTNKDGLSPLSATQWLSNNKSGSNSESKRDIFTSIVLNAMPKKTAKASFQQAAEKGQNKKIAIPKKAVFKNKNDNEKTSTSPDKKGFRR